MKRIISALLVIITIITTFTLPIHASSIPDYSETIIVTSIDPRLNNGNSCSKSFNITSSGFAGVTVNYQGISGVTTKVTSTVYIQKKFLGLFWTKVDIGTTDDEWVDSSTNVSGTFSHSVQLGSSGTYRAVFEIKMYGSGGATDTIEDKIEKKY